MPSDAMGHNVTQTSESDAQRQPATLHQVGAIRLHGGALQRMGEDGQWHYVVLPLTAVSRGAAFGLGTRHPARGYGWRC